MLTVHTFRSSIALTAVVLLSSLFLLPSMVFGLSPDFLVNTESFETVGTGDGTDPIDIYFGDPSNFFRYDQAAGTPIFVLSDTLSVEGDLSADGTLTINADAGTGEDAIAYFATDGGTGNITYIDSSQSFSINTDTDIAGVLTANGLSADDLANCEYITANATGRLVCSTLSDLADSLTPTFDDLYVNTAGDTMTGALVVQNTIDATGDITTTADVNGDDVNATTDVNAGNDVNATQDVTAGNDVAATNDVTAGNDITATNDITAGGTGSFANLVVPGFTTFNGVQYLWPAADGAAGEVLTTDGAGNLIWTGAVTVNPLEHVVTIYPDYPNVSYYETAANNIGRLTTSYDAVADENFYTWFTSRNTQQQYSIAVRYQVPQDFNGWDAAGMEFDYRTFDTVGDNVVDIQLLDTAGVVDPAFGATGLENTAWTTYTAVPTGTYTPGEDLTIIVTLNATRSGGNGFADAGKIKFNWTTD